MYDSFVPGRFTVAERSMQAFDAVRNRSFPCDIWCPTAAAGIRPIILLSHSSGSGRRGYTFLTNHGMYEVFERVPATKRMVILRRADHMHFMDNVEQLHEAVRTSPPWVPEPDYLSQVVWVVAKSLRHLHSVHNPLFGGGLHCGRTLQCRLRHFVRNQDDPVRTSESRRAGPATSRIVKCPRPRPDTRNAVSTTIGPIPGVATKTRIK